MHPVTETVTALVTATQEGQLGGCEEVTSASVWAEEWLAGDSRLTHEDKEGAQCVAIRMGRAHCGQDGSTGTLPHCRAR